MSMEEFGDLFSVARDVREKAFELLRHRANRSLCQKVGQMSRFFRQLCAWETPELTIGLFRYRWFALPCSMDRVLQPAVRS